LLAQIDGHGSSNHACTQYDNFFAHVYILFYAPVRTTGGIK